jgi:putative redox protein
MTTRVTLSWHGGNRFVGFGASGPPVLINFAAGEAPLTATGAAVAARTARSAVGAEPTGPKPTELLLMATGACTGLDVVSLLEKQRVTFSGLDIEVTGERAPDHPKYFTDIEVAYRLKAAPDALPHLQRAAALSMEKYCSVGHSLRAKETWRCEIV